MIENPTAVTIGGRTWLCPVMVFFCLERAWPHIHRMSKMAQAAQQLRTAQLQTRNATTPEEHLRATANVEAAERVVEALEADVVGQTKAALHIIAAALALDSAAPSYDDLAKVLRPDEIAGVHIACGELMDASGLVTRGDARTLGEALAAKEGQSLHGAPSSLN